MIIVAFVWISQVVILRLHDVIPITRVISRRVSIARSVQYHILRDDHAYFHDITQEHFPRGLWRRREMRSFPMQDLLYRARSKSYHRWLWSL